MKADYAKIPLNCGKSQITATSARVLTRDEMESLLAQPDLRDKSGKRDRCMLELLYAAGLRVSELCTMCVRILTCNGPCARFWQGFKRRLVPLHDLMQQMLADYISACEPLLRPQATSFSSTGRAVP